MYGFSAAGHYALRVKTEMFLPPVFGKKLHRLYHFTDIYPPYIPNLCITRVISFPAILKKLKEKEEL